MGRAIDRLPVDFEEPREQPKRQARQSDINNDSHHTLIAVLAGPQKAERDEDARRYLRRKGHADLIDVFGLAEPPPPVEKPAPKKTNGPLTVACPRCESPPGARCVTDKGVGISKTHVARQPQTEELNEEKTHG